jgi:hypothetical protein
MAEIILRIVGALIERLIDGVLESTGRKVLSYWRMKSNPFVEVLVGICFGQLCFCSWVCLSSQFWATDRLGQLRVMSAASAAQGVTSGLP